MTCFWRHDELFLTSWRTFDVMTDILTSWRTFWRYDKLFDVMRNYLIAWPVFDVMMNFLSSWRIYDVMTNVLASWRVFYVMNFLSSWRIYDFMTNLLASWYIFTGYVYRACMMSELFKLIFLLKITYMIIPFEERSRLCVFLWLVSADLRVTFSLVHVCLASFILFADVCWCEQHMWLIIIIHGIQSYVFHNNEGSLPAVHHNNQASSLSVHTADMLWFS